MVKTVKLFVEGGGNSNSLHTECRSAFNSFLKKAGFYDHMPRIVACGSRNNAYDSYCTAIKNGEDAILLVDSEAPVLVPPNATGYVIENIKTWIPWYHLGNRLGADGQRADNLDKPQNASEDDCHLMVEMMEAWFLADIDALKAYYGQGFNPNALPRPSCIEEIAKGKLVTALESATSHTKKGKYNKGSHSFEILGRIDPNKVTEKSQWANRFITLLKEKMIHED